MDIKINRGLPDFILYFNLVTLNDQASECDTCIYTHLIRKLALNK